MKSINYIEDPNEWKSEFSFSVPIKVRFSETDMYGHVNNTSVFIYFEEARIEFLQSLDLFTDLGQNPIGFVVADLQCNYLRQMYFNETIHFYVKIASLGTTSMDLHYMAVNNQNEVTVTGRGRIVMMDFRKNKTKAIPDEMRSILVKEIIKQDELKSKPTF